MDEFKYSVGQEVVWITVPDSITRVEKRKKHKILGNCYKIKSTSGWVYENYLKEACK